MKKLILVIEDDISTREALKLALDHFGYDVLTASNGQDGLDVLMKSPNTDLILADVNMPDLNGLDFRKFQMATLEIKHIPIIFMSADDENNDKSHGLNAYEFLNKPLDLEDLRRVVANFFLLRA